MIKSRFKDNTEYSLYIRKNCHCKTTNWTLTSAFNCNIQPGRLKTESGKRNFTRSYKAQSKLFQTEFMIIMGGFNAHIGNNIIPGVKQQFNEPVFNSNSELMINLCCYNELRISDTFYPHKQQHKYTFHNTRGQKSTTDYIVTNRKIYPFHILDVTPLNSANIGSDHNLLIWKIRIKNKPTKSGNIWKTHPEE